MLLRNSVIKKNEANKKDVINMENNIFYNLNEDRLFAVTLLTKNQMLTVIKQKMNECVQDKKLQKKFFQAVFDVIQRKNINYYRTSVLGLNVYEIPIFSISSISEDIFPIEGIQILKTKIDVINYVKN
jgi:hypothetical protein